jgi:hypothetical protein
VLGEDYDSRLEQYVNVAGDTAGEDDDGTAETYQTISDDQQNFANATQSYEETYDRYQDAQDAGNTTAAREAARELENLSVRVTRLNESIANNYSEIENQTGIETETARNTISNTSEEIQTQQSIVDNETFVQTALTVSTNETAVAFDNPLRMSGQLRMANGTAVSNRTIRLSMYERTYVTSTDAAGNFTVSYRPVRLPLSASDVSIGYRPAIDSPYLGSDETVPVTVTQVMPSATVTVSPASRSYGDVLNVTADVTVDGRPVPQLPVESQLGLATSAGTTDTQGEAALGMAVPASIEAGQQAVSVENTREQVAIGAFNATGAVTIISTPTDLSTTATQSGREVLVQGRLVTEDETPVTGQPVQVTVGETVESATTNQTGWYRLTVNISGVGEDGSTIPISAQFDGANTNLESTQLTTSLEISIPQRGNSGGNSVAGSVPLAVVLAICAVILVVIGTVAFWIRATGMGERTDAETQTEAEGVATAERQQVTQQLLSNAREALSEGNLEDATVSAYGAVREQLRDQANRSGELTHREFLTAIDTQIPDSLRKHVSVVADAYERATFAGRVDAESAEEAVGAAESVSADEE